MIRVLIVEDQPEIRMLVRMTLESDRYELHEADGGESGLHMVDALSPQVVVLDIMLPGSLSGLEVCKRIKSNPGTRDTPVLLLSVRAQQADLEAGERSGADVYLPKPFSPTELIGKIEALAARSLNNPARLR